MPKTISQNRVSKYSKHIRKYKNRINPKIAKDIASIIKPYWELINKSSDYYKLRTLAIDVGKINIKVKEDVEYLLFLCQKAVQFRIEKKINRIEEKDKTKDFNITNIKDFLDKHNMSRNYYRILFNAIYGNMIINLGLEDFKLITDNANKVKFYSFEVSPILNAEELLKPKLKGMNNAILILTGNNETTLDELAYVWDSALKYLPKNGKTTFAYKIDDVEKMQLNLMAVK